MSVVNTCVMCIQIAMAGLEPLLVMCILVQLPGTGNTAAQWP